MSYLFLILTVIFSIICQGQTLKVDCANASTQAEMHMCAAKAFQKADQELNLVYKEVISRLEKSAKTSFVTAQKSWLLVRDNHCAVYGHLYEGGSMVPLVINTCKTELTQNRVSELKTLLRTLKSQ
ncbi:DUF1311 domain-containing protein [Adhaeribacter sp. BT258]|uniref:DUF1311 domain-containing protein n=1 Tax=Adhaeribacter terrigena TaxID=2793070 RepID=A0ABS1C1H9_9BACT|nr:lysozyme inhibitor LprI family protein [Adhaeribacter terrigena]MBK0403185.1 DUF1311 domain-containing protein [Adhaeribacter terrigena]